MSSTNTNIKTPLFPMGKIPLNVTEVSQSKLNIEKKLRSNFFPWNGQFSPQLVEALLKKYASPNSKIFDPFMGSGTVLAESARFGLLAIGTEINPAAVQFATTYTLCQLPSSAREKYIHEIQDKFNNVLNCNILNSSRDDMDREIQGNELQKIFLDLKSSESKQLYKTFLLLLDYKIKVVTLKKFKSLWERFCDFILCLPHSDKKIIILNRDARNTMLPDMTFDLILTSPPYINVFNYHQQYRATSEEFGYNVLEIAKAEIGSNRKNRSNRFLTVIQYIIDMAKVFKELRRVCNRDARLIFIIGRESMVKKTKFFNGEIITKVAYHCSAFSPILRQERVFKNRFGANIFEEIIHFLQIRMKKLIM